MAEDEKKQTETAATKASESNKQDGNKAVLIVTIVNLLITLGIVGALVFTFQEQKNAQVGDISLEDAERDAEEVDEVLQGKALAATFGRNIPLAQFNINLSTAGNVSPKFARVSIFLEVASEDTEIEIQQKMPQVRNAIIDLFNSKRPSDIAGPEGRNYLREEIKSAINSFLVSGQVRGVFFTNFVVSG
jgi:flagellar protein FliL